MGCLNGSVWQVILRVVGCTENHLIHFFFRVFKFEAVQKRMSLNFIGSKWGWAAILGFGSYFTATQVLYVGNLKNISRFFFSTFFFFVSTQSSCRTSCSRLWSFSGDSSRSERRRDELSNSFDSISNPIWSENSSNEDWFSNRKQRWIAWRCEKKENNIFFQKKIFKPSQWRCVYYIDLMPAEFMKFINVWDLNLIKKRYRLLEMKC